MSFAFIGLGGTDEVGASSYLYLLKEGNLLIDAGLRPGLIGRKALPQLDLLDENPPTAIILTHAHLDHVAGLPAVTRRFPHTPIYCTPATATLVSMVLADTLKVSTQQGFSMFSLQEMKHTLKRLRPIHYFDYIADHGFAFVLRPSGHLLGAASVLIESGGRTIFHTGDVSNVETPVVTSMWIPEQIQYVDVVVTESTYGDTLLPARKQQVQTFVQAIGETLKAGGRVLIPSFALGRAQEITQILITSMQSGQLPKTSIYLDGLTRAMTKTYEELTDLLPQAIQNRKASSGKPAFLTDPVVLVKNQKQRESIINSDQAAVVIASSGMLHAGVSPQYARAWLPHSENTLFVVGYQDAESPGHRLLELKQGEEISLPDHQGGSTPITAYARIERFYLSAHADRSGLISLISRYHPSKIILTHGEVAARHNLAGYLNTKHDVALPATGEMITLQDSGKRRKSFLGGKTSVHKPQAMKERYAKTKVQLRYDQQAHTLTIDLPTDLDGTLFGDGDYSLEVLRSKLSRIKLKQNDPETTKQNQHSIVNP